MEWIFDGIGTLLVGLVAGGGAGTFAGYKFASKRQKQSQRAGSNSEQAQAGRDIRRGRG